MIIDPHEDAVLRACNNTDTIGDLPALEAHMNTHGKKNMIAEILTVAICIGGYKSC